MSLQTIATEGFLPPSLDGIATEGFLVSISAVSVRGRTPEKKKEPPVFITHLEERRRLDEELERQRELDLKRDEREQVQALGLTDVQKLELIAFLEQMEEIDRENLLMLAEDEILAIILLMQ